MPLLAVILPGLISIADKIFTKSSPDAPSRGQEKKSYVMRILEIAFDAASEKGILPDLVKGQKELVLAVLSQMVDETVKAIKGK